MQSKNLNIKTNLFLRLNFYFTCLLIVWCFTPYLMRNMQEFFVVLIGGWWLTAFFSILSKKSFLIQKRDKVIIVTILWFIILSLYIVFQLPNFHFGNYFYIILYYMPIFFLVFFYKFGNMIYIKKVINFSLLVLFVNSLINIRMLVSNPYAAKEATGRYGLIDYSNTNVITDQFAFAIVLAVYLGIMGNQFSKHKHIKVAYLILSFVSITLLIQSTFFIAIISLFIILISYILLKGNPKDSIIKGLFAIVLISLLFVFKANIANIAKELIILLTDNTLIINRIYLLSDLISNYSISGTLEARLINIKNSLDTFWDNPFFGKGFIIDFNSSNTGIGNHSYIFDNLARVGIFGFTIELLVYVFFNKYIVFSLKESPLKKYYLCSWLGFVFYALFNPIAYPSIGIMVFFVFPLFVYYKSSITFGSFKEN